MRGARTNGAGGRVLVRCCSASGCRLQGADGLRKALEAGAMNAATPGATVEIRGVGCLGLCSQGPLVGVDGGPCHGLYGGLTATQGTALMAAVVGAAPPGQLARTLRQLEPQRLPIDLPFFALQHPLVLEHCGWIAPDSIEAALAVGTYSQLLACLDGRSPAEVRGLISRSGLRGRGGAGFPTGLKWERVATEAAVPKLVVANGDEGDPGAFMDRTVMESDPHRLLEGLAIAAYAVGADRGILFVRAEYPQAVAQLQRAIRDAEAHGLLGASVAGRRFSFRVVLRVGAGAYVCGEETALMAAVEGRRGTPRPRPPYPAHSGLWQQPTLINNVETLAAVPAILAMGPEAYGALGTAESRGTKVVSLSGAIRHGGVVEVPLGISLRTLVEEIGGGAPPGRPIKAVQTGGPGGGFVPAHLLDVALDHDSLRALGSAMGSGGVVVIGEPTPIPALVDHFLRFCADESCGKCVPCRAGTQQLLALHATLRAGGGDRGIAHTQALLVELAAMVGACSLCGLGQNAPNPLLSSLRHFAAEYGQEPAGRSGP